MQDAVTGTSLTVTHRFYTFHGNQSSQFFWSSLRACIAPSWGGPHHDQSPVAPLRQPRSNGSRHTCGVISACIAFGPHEPGA